MAKKSKQIDHLVSLDTLGAWVFKCDPKTFDIAAMVADGDDWVTGWTIADNYRSEMMAAGQPAILWVSGPTKGAKGDPLPGIWGIGHVAGRAEWSAFRESGELDGGYWINKKKEQAASYGVPLDVKILPKPLDRKILKQDFTLRTAEVFRMPQGSNPTFLNKEEFSALRKLIKKWPKFPDSAGEPDIKISIGSAGAGFGTAETNEIVEERAMSLVISKYKKSGYKVEDVSSKNLGWDLTAASKKDVKDVRHIEVKGVSGISPKIFLTRNEFSKAKEDSLWELAIVIKALSKKPQVLLYPAKSIWEATKPFMWQADMTQKETFKL